MTPQGTSSMKYPRKNLRPYIDGNKGKGKPATCYDYKGNLVENKYQHTDNGVPCTRWTWKADFAESSGTHNAGIAKLWNDAMYNAVVGGEYVLRTKAQQAAEKNKATFPYKVRTTVDGFPMVVFYRLSETDDLVFMGKYNFLNDKSSEDVFGFTGIPGMEDYKDTIECWEVLDNKGDIPLFIDSSEWNSLADDGTTKKWALAFEGRYPDGNKNTTQLKRLCDWLSSCCTVSTVSGKRTYTYNYEKFSSEKADYFDLNKLAAYYIYLMRFGAVDQAVKNAMLTTEDGQHWFFINYDNDTVNGVRNDGLLRYGTTIDRQSYDSGISDYCYAGHDSTLWNCFEHDDELMKLVPVIDNALYIAGLRYDDVIDMFNNTFAAKWCERVYNQDAEYKYVASYLDKG